jgi:hypothetical protein
MGTVMSKQTWSQDTIGRGAGAVLLAAAMLVPSGAGAYPIDGGSARGAAHQISSFGIPDEGPQVEELDPTDDGFIIIECVGFVGPAALNAREPHGAFRMRTVAMPQFPLGPSTCSPQEHKRA